MANTGASTVLGLRFPFVAHCGVTPRRHRRSNAGGGPQQSTTPPNCYGSFSSKSWDQLHRRCSRLRASVARKVISNQVELEDSLDDEACELVRGAELVLGDSQESVRAYLLKAVKNNNGVGVLLLSDIFGFEDSSTRDFAYRVACNGYNVLVPDLFRGNPWKKGHSMAEVELWLAKQQPETITKDIDISVKWMIDQLTTAGVMQKLGIVGFGFGGGCLIKALAFDEQACFGTGVCFYGSDLNPSLAGNIKVPVLFVCGDSDPLCPVSTLRQMEKSIEGSRAVIYDGRGHGFAHRPESQEDDEAAEAAFSTMRNWLHEHLHICRN